MPNPDTPEPGSSEIDAEDARAAFEALRDELAAIPPQKLLNPRIDMQKAAAHVFSLAERDSAPARAAAFERLAAAGVIAPPPLDRYKRAALATWYARQQQLRFAALGSGVVPAAIVEDASALKRRMLKNLTHYFEDHPIYGLEILAIRAGQGHQDMANDLQMLADLYVHPEILAIVSRDPVHYFDTDVRDARALGAEIFRALGFESRESAEWTDHVRRVYTYMHDGYEEHCHAGALLFFRSEDVRVTYPASLVSVVRLAPTRASDKSGSTDTTNTTETETDGGSDA